MGDSGSFLVGANSNRKPVVRLAILTNGRKLLREHTPELA
jgi:hypothetical protein